MKEEISSEDESTSERPPRRRGAPSSVFDPRSSVFDRKSEVGPWDSVSQLSTRLTSNSETKRVKRNTMKNKGPNKRNRRANPEQVLKAADIQKHTVRKNIEEAKRLWERLELPVKGDVESILEEYTPEVIRYAKQGKRFVELAGEIGTIKARNRNRDEWKAYCYARNLDHRQAVQNTGFEDAYASYLKRVKTWNDEYYRSR